MSYHDAFADELVSLQGGGDGEAGTGFVAERAHTIGADNLAHAAQRYGLGAVMIQRDHIFDGAADIRLSFGGKEDSAGTDVFGLSRESHAFGAGTCDGERKLELKAPSSTLFHVVSVNNGRSYAGYRSIDLVSGKLLLVLGSVREKYGVKRIFGGLFKKPRSEQPI